MIEFEIDGKTVSVEPGTTIIEAADQHGIYIPRFCYHKQLSVAANCRMCLVEVEKLNKPQVACATPVSANMKVMTQSKMALDGQRAVMEYLLINHPLDCPICDQGGECELQDLSMGFGCDHSDYEQTKRAVFDEDLGPLISTCMTRCIQCTRCVRFGQEVTGVRELGVLNRTEKERIGTYVSHMMQSEMSGNIIDLCPVGALLSKPFRFTARSWELLETPMIAPHDCVGSNIFVHSRSQEFAPQKIVMRVVPRQNEKINETWISDRDRFSYLGLMHEDRIKKPQIKQHGEWQEISWQDVLFEMVERLRTIREEFGAEQIAALVSPNATLEECYVLQKLLRGLGSSNIDHRLRQQDFSDQHWVPEFPNLGVSIEGLSRLDAIILVGADVRRSAPLLFHRIYQAQKRGAKIIVINPLDEQYPFTPTEKIITADLVNTFIQILAVVVKEAGESVPALENIQISENARKIAAYLRTSDAQTTGIFIGDYAGNHPQGALIRLLIRLLTKYTGVTIGCFTEGANSSGAWLAGAVPHRGPAGAKVESEGTHAKALLTTSLKRAYFLLGCELEYDCGYPAAAVAAMTQAELVICMTPFVTKAMLEYAHIILPIAPFTETDGTFVNVAGDWQSFTAATKPHGEAKPAWKIINILAHLMQVEGFNYQSAEQICADLKAQVEKMPAYQPPELMLPQELPAPITELSRYAPWPIYRVDGLCRRAQALQATRIDLVESLIVHPDVAADLQLNPGDSVIVRQGDQKINLKLNVNDRLAPHLVLLPSGIEETVGFGEAYAPIRVEPGR